VSPIRAALDPLAGEVAELTARLGQRVDVASMGVLDRTGHVALAPPGLASPNRACRLFRAADGWMALNLAREEDRDLVPAWLGCDFGADPWDSVAAHGGEHSTAELVARATLLGLPAGAVGEVVRDGLEAVRNRHAEAGAPVPLRRAVDLSALWAGPMCGAILAAAGAEVIKVESPRRPDPTRTTTPEFFRRLNAGKIQIDLDLATPEGQARLLAEITAADVLISGARPRALGRLGLDPARVYAANPRLVWVAVTGYGWSGEAGERVAFGDDAAAAGGLVGWSQDGTPRFLGDALADPVTGLAAAIGALKGLSEGGGVMVDVSLAGSAAGAARVCKLRSVA
jgi:hypothetical protein